MSKTGTTQAHVTLDAVPVLGDTVRVEFDRVTHWYHDAHYGADADGNRGIPVDDIDEELAEDVRVTLPSGLVVPLTDLAPIHQDVINEAITEFLEKTPCGATAPNYEENYADVPSDPDD